MLTALSTPNPTRANGSRLNTTANPRTTSKTESTLPKRGTVKDAPTSSSDAYPATASLLLGTSKGTFSVATVALAGSASVGALILQAFAFLRKNLNWRALEQCGVDRIGANDTTYIVEVDGQVKIVGVASCKSRWLCPLHVLRGADVRRRLLLELLSTTMASGAAYFGTATMPIPAGMRLSTSWSLLNDVWARVAEDSTLGLVRTKLGVSGLVRITETVVEQGKWNPHSHFLYLCKGPLTQAEETELLVAWHKAWSRACRSILRRSAVLTGSELARISNSEDAASVAWYMTKQNFRHAVLRAQRGGAQTSRDPWQILLDAMASDAPAADIALLQEYRHASAGKQTMPKTPELRKKLNEHSGGVFDATWTVAADIEEEEEVSFTFIDKLRSRADAEQRAGSEQYGVSIQHALNDAA